MGDITYIPRGWRGEALKLEVETYFFTRVYSVSSDFSPSEWESPRSSEFLKILEILQNNLDS